MKKFWLIAALAASTALAGCVDDHSGSARETTQQLQMQEAASVEVGMPALRNYAEKRLLKLIYELRDDPKYVTYSYTTDMQGKMHAACPGASIGFPIPYAAQYTAPKALRYGKPIYPSGAQGSGDWKAWESEQPEPNGLYMPASADGTWVVCASPDPKDTKPKVAYIEDKVRAYPFPVPDAAPFGH